MVRLDSICCRLFVFCPACGYPVAIDPDCCDCGRPAVGFTKRGYPYCDACLGDQAFWAADGTCCPDCHAALEPPPTPPEVP